MLALTREHDPIMITSRRQQSKETKSWLQHSSACLVCLAYLSSEAPSSPANQQSMRSSPSMRFVPTAVSYGSISFIPTSKRPFEISGEIEHSAPPLLLTKASIKVPSNMMRNSRLIALKLTTNRTFAQISHILVPFLHRSLITSIT